MMRSIKILAIVGMTTITLSLPVSAQNAEERILKTEGQVSAINDADAARAAGENWTRTQLRLQEAKTAIDDRDEKIAKYRAHEASVQADIVQEKIKLAGLERTADELQSSVNTLQRELSN
ncbi:MAG: hypothetical protein AAF583_00175 [Pseudomonadota bacterium]